MLVLGLVTALVLTVRIEEWRLGAQRRRVAAAMLVVSNESAERDTTRDVATHNARVAKLLGDSLRMVEKQVVQVSQKRDALDRALGRERVARYSATAVVDSLERFVAAKDSVVRDAAREVRIARFDVREEPFYDRRGGRVAAAAGFGEDAGEGGGGRDSDRGAGYVRGDWKRGARGGGVGADAGVGDGADRDRVSVARGVRRAAAWIGLGAAIGVPHLVRVAEAGRGGGASVEYRSSRSVVRLRRRRHRTVGAGGGPGNRSVRLA
jgi:hypothetical protein